VGRTARFDAEAREKFLEELRRRGNVTDAAGAAGFGRSVAYEHRKADSEFAPAWQGALDEAADALEREAWRRGAEGVSRPVYQQGGEVGSRSNSRATGSSSSRRSSTRRWRARVRS
jgi:hypothetical protein